jgi:hypothetical protein
MIHGLVFVERMNKSMNKILNNKIKKSFYIQKINNDLDGLSISETIEYLNKLKEKYSDKYEDLYLDYADYDGLCLYGQKLETDEQYKKRVEACQTQKELELNRLKARAKELGFDLVPIYC